jgi:hypothetical protein
MKNAELSLKEKDEGEIDEETTEPLPFFVPSFYTSHESAQITQKVDNWTKKTISFQIFSDMVD